MNVHNFNDVKPPEELVTSEQEIINQLKVSCINHDLISNNNAENLMVYIAIDFFEKNAIENYFSKLSVVEAFMDQFKYWNVTEISPMQVVVAHRAEMLQLGWVLFFKFIGTKKEA